MTHENCLRQKLKKNYQKVSGPLKISILSIRETNRYYEKSSCVWCFTKALNKIFEFGSFLPWSVSKFLKSICVWCFTKVLNKIYEFGSFLPWSVCKFLKSAWFIEIIALNSIKGPPYISVTNKGRNVIFISDYSYWKNEQIKKLSLYLYVFLRHSQKT